MARPWKEPELLNKRVIFRCSELLYEKIRDAATAAGLTQCDMIRRKLSGIRVPDRSLVNFMYLARTLRADYIRQQNIMQAILNALTSSGKGGNEKLEKELRMVIEAQRELIKKTTDLVIRMDKKQDEIEKDLKKKKYL